jgi:hypothetical protein
MTHVMMLNYHNKFQPISQWMSKKKMTSLLAAFRREKTKIKNSKGTGSGKF